MSAVLLRFVVIAILLGMIYFGLRRIVGDWRQRFRDLDQDQRQRDLKERERPDVIDLKRGDDGVFRPGDKDKDD